MLDCLLPRINNSAPAVTHLLTAVSASAFIVHPTFATVAAEAVSLLKESHACKVFEHADGETVYGAEARSKARAAAGDAPLAWEWPLTEEEEADLPAFIVRAGFPSIKSVERTAHSIYRSTLRDQPASLRCVDVALLSCLCLVSP